MFRQLLLLSICVICTNNLILAQDSTEVYWEEFYPLHIGDFWKYVIEWISPPIVEIETKEVVAETTMSNNITYKKILRINHTFEQRGYDYERVDSLGDVYGYETIFTDSVRQEDVLLWSLGIEVGDTWEDWHAQYSDYWQLKDKFLVPFWGGDSVIYLGYRFYKYASEEVLWDSTDVSIIQNLGRASQWGGGCGSAPENLVGAVIKGKVYGDTSTINTDVKKNAEIIFKDFILYQNYPNPFNSFTHFRYELAKGGDATLQIFNLNGEVVKTLVNHNQKGGEYQVFWNGFDEFGKEVTSGIYFCQLRVNGRIQTRKLTLIR